MTPALEKFVRDRRLGPQHQLILRALLAGVRRCELGLKLGIAENTIKSQVRGLLKATGCERVEEVLADALRACAFIAMPAPAIRDR